MNVGFLHLQATKSRMVRDNTLLSRLRAAFPKAILFVGKFNMKINPFLLVVPFAATLLAGCSSTSTSSRAAEAELKERIGFHSILADSSKTKYRTLNLWHGKDIKIIGIEEVALQSTSESALLLKYQTTLPVADNSALRDEMIDIWSRFTGDLTLAKKRFGIITAVETPKKGAKQLMTYTRAYHNKENLWQPITR